MRHNRFLIKTHAKEGLIYDESGGREKPRKTTKRYGTSQWGEAWIHLKRDKEAMMGSVITCILLCCTSVPSPLAPYDLDEQRPAEAPQ